jgi:hypothetical protein
MPMWAYVVLRGREPLQKENDPMFRRVARLTLAVSLAFGTIVGCAHPTESTAHANEAATVASVVGKTYRDTSSGQVLTFHANNRASVFTPGQGFATHRFEQSEGSVTVFFGDFDLDLTVAAGGRQLREDVDPIAGGSSIVYDVIDPAAILTGKTFRSDDGGQLTFVNGDVLTYNNSVSVKYTGSVGLEGNVGVSFSPDGQTGIDLTLTADGRQLREDVVGGNNLVYTLVSR